MKKQPIFERSVAKNAHFQIDDCFFRFWFRFVHKLRYLDELGRRDRMRDIAERDFDRQGATVEGLAMEHTIDLIVDIEVKATDNL